MPIHARGARAALTVIAAATASLFLSALPATARPVPEPIDQTAPARVCPSIDALAQPLRTAGFAAQATHNYAVLIHRDCIEEI